MPAQKHIGKAVYTARLLQATPLQAFLSTFQFLNVMKQIQQLSISIFLVLQLTSLGYSQTYMSQIQKNNEILILKFFALVLNSCCLERLLSSSRFPDLTASINLPILLSCAFDSDISIYFCSIITSFLNQITIVNNKITPTLLKKTL